LTINTAGALAGPGAFDITILSTLVPVCAFHWQSVGGRSKLLIRSFLFVDTVFNPNDLSSSRLEHDRGVWHLADSHADVIEFTYQPSICRQRFHLCRIAPTVKTWRRLD
jgi:hypothetical protein